MAHAGSGGWIPSVRVFVRDRQLHQAQISHNVPPEAVWMPEQAAACFVDHPKAYIYVPIRDGGGLDYLHALLTEMGLIGPLADELAAQWPDMPDVTGVDVFSQHPITGQE